VHEGSENGPLSRVSSVESDVTVLVSSECNRVLESDAQPIYSSVTQLSSAQFSSDQFNSDKLNSDQFQFNAQQRLRESSEQLCVGGGGGGGGGVWQTADAKSQQTFLNGNSQNTGAVSAESQSSIAEALRQQLGIDLQKQLRVELSKEGRTYRDSGSGSGSDTALWAVPEGGAGRGLSPVTDSLEATPMGSPLSSSICSSMVSSVYLSSLQPAASTSDVYATASDHSDSLGQCKQVHPHPDNIQIKIKVNIKIQVKVGWFGCCFTPTDTEAYSGRLVTLY
jgi:hypothetical protein